VATLPTAERASPVRKRPPRPLFALALQCTAPETRQHDADDAQQRMKKAMLTEQTRPGASGDLVNAPAAVPTEHGEQARRPTACGSTMYSMLEWLVH